MALETTVTYKDGVRFSASTRGHEIICDQPAENGGSDLGMTPPELLLASLGTCIGYYAAEYLKARQLPTAGLTVSVNAEKAVKPARLAEFKVRLHVPDLHEERHRSGILRAANNCLIHNTLLHAPSIEIELADPGAELGAREPESVSQA